MIMITLTSSFGDIHIDDDGVPLSTPPLYNNIAKFDIHRLEKMCIANHVPLRSTWDILAVGYWTEDGTYEPPAKDYDETGYMRHIWSGTVNSIEDALDLNEESLL